MIYGIILIIVFAAWIGLLVAMVRMDKHMANPGLHSGNYLGAGYEKMPEISSFTLEEIHAAQEMVRQSEIEKRNGDAIETR